MGAQCGTCFVLQTNIIIIIPEFWKIWGHLYGMFCWRHIVGRIRSHNRYSYSAGFNTCQLIIV